MDEYQKKASKIVKKMDELDMDLLDVFMTWILHDGGFVGYLNDNYYFILDEEEF